MAKPTPCRVIPMSKMKLSIPSSLSRDCAAPAARLS
jgi:hypothetical protein